MDAFWPAFFQFAIIAVPCIVGYISLRHKASAANVDAMQFQIDALIRDVKQCQTDRKNQAMVFAESQATSSRRIDELSAKLLEMTGKVGEATTEAAHATGLATGLVQGATQGLDAPVIKGVIAVKESDAFTRGYDQAVKDIAGKNRDVAAKE